MDTLSVDQIEQQLQTELSEAQNALQQAQSAADVESVRVGFLGRKGKINAHFEHLKRKDLDGPAKARLGQALNAAKQQIETSIEQAQQTAGPSSGGKKAKPQADWTLPGKQPLLGGLHPITQTIDQIVAIFEGLGFDILDGPEAETERYNFEALNIPENHPSREGFDTFYLEASQNPQAPGPFLLRSHTSPMQVRFMEKHKPPFQVVVPGRVFRPDAVDATHCFQFHQVEGLAVGPDITFGDLKGALMAWAKGMFGDKAKLRFRPHHFPFTEPSAEVDLACIFCDQKGCRVCGHNGWLEILGCGMVHPHVFESVGYLSETTGFAFGLGVERIAMLLYGIEDIRFFFENDLRFLKQFSG